MKRLFQVLVTLLPWPIKRWILQRYWGYELAPDAWIGFSYIYPRKLVMAEKACIGHLNVAIHLDRLDCGAQSIIGRSNWITGHPRDGDHFTHRTERDPTFVLGAHAAVTKSHLIDCTDRVEIGPFTTLAGYRSQVLTHGIDLAGNYQDCRPVRIGAYCLVGTCVTVVGGAVLPDYCQLGAGAVLNKALVDPYTLYAGQPAVARKGLDPAAAYFHRTNGSVH